MPAVFESQLPNNQDGQPLTQNPSLAMQALRQRLGDLEEACRLEAPLADLRQLEATSPVIWSKRRATIYIGHVLTAEDVLEANNPNPTLTQEHRKVDNDLAGQLALGHQLSVTRTSVKGPDGYACLALDLALAPADQLAEGSKLRLLVPAEALGTVTMGSYDYYRSLQHPQFDAEAYLRRFER